MSETVRAAESWCEKQLAIKELEDQIATLKDEQAELIPTIRAGLNPGQQFNFFGRTWEYTLDSRGSVSYKAAIDAFKTLADDQHQILLEAEVDRATKPPRDYPKLRVV